MAESQTKTQMNGLSHSGIAVRATDSSPLEGGRFCKTASMSGSSTIDSDGLLGLYRTATAFPFR
jgi:hypothetical protein